MRIAMGIEYDGSHYHGWQTQTHVASVAATLQNAIAQIADHAITVTCAGRTDAGVHACGQVIHFNAPVDRPQKAWVLGVNTHLPSSIRVHWAQAVDEAFHARFSALSRTYEYIILNQPVPSALLKNYSTHWRHDLNVGKMQQAAQYLLGEHDFSAFRSSACQSKTAMRRIDRIDLKRWGPFVMIRIQANAFLHHMVRNIVGTLLVVGEQKQPIEWMKTVRDTKDRTKAGITAPPEGLYLANVTYPDRFDLPKSWMNHLFQKLNAEGGHCELV